MQRWRHLRDNSHIQIGCKHRNKAVRQRSDLLFIATSFWFEESPCAVQTNTVGLCTLFVLSTLLVFEHMHAVLSSTLVLCRTMVKTNTAAISNSRYADTDRVKNVFWSDFRNRTWIEPKPNECLQIWRVYRRCLYQEGHSCVHCILSVILSSLWTMCTTIYL